MSGAAPSDPAGVLEIAPATAAPAAAPQAARTPLHDLNVELGARMVPFAGYDMPLHYPAGIMAEHTHTRTGCGLFDVSHMGQLRIASRTGDLRDAALAFERLVPTDIVSLKPGRQRYAMLTDDAGGILDDLMVANAGDHLFVVVNAGRKHDDLRWMREHLPADCVVEPLPDRGLLALQGPGAEAALSRLAPEAAAMRFMDFRVLDVAGMACTVSRSGYTGEDGYEIGTDPEHAVPLARALLADPAVRPIGLGARDSLRLEAGLCLYGLDIDVTTTPVEASLDWAIQKTRRFAGSRAGNFHGAGIVLDQLENGTNRRRVGLRPEGRAPVRAGARLFRSAAEGRDGAEPVGHVTSGAFGPTVQAPVAMGYLAQDLCTPGTTLVAELRGRFIPVTVSPLPFVASSYKR